MHLHSVGFETREIFPCNVRDGRIFIPARIGGSASELLLDTGAVDEVILSLSYVSERGFPFDHQGLFYAPLADAPPREGGFATVSEIAALGRTLRPNDVAVKDFEPGAIPRSVAGLLGGEYFRDGILGIDPRRGQVAFSTRRFLPDHPRLATCRLRTIPLSSGCVPITSEIQDGFTRKSTGAALLLDTGTEDSYLMLDYIHREHGMFVRWLSDWVHRMGRPITWAFDVGDDISIRPRTWVRTSLSPYAQRRGVAHVDGILGMNFLEHWIVVFDFANGSVDLIEQCSERSKLYRCHPTVLGSNTDP